MGNKVEAVLLPKKIIDRYAPKTEKGKKVAVLGVALTSALFGGVAGYRLSEAIHQSSQYPPEISGGMTVSQKADHGDPAIAEAISVATNRVNAKIIQEALHKWLNPTRNLIADTSFRVG